jgi:choline-glycine betaine transporter
MHDRRVVRGNTFAALVIPVSKFIYVSVFICVVDMQPDPVMMERQKQEQMMKKQRSEQIRKRQQDDQQRMNMMQEEENQRTQIMDMQN